MVVQMDWSSSIAVFAALVGSTGIAGLLAGGLQVSHAVRLRKGISESSLLLKDLGDATLAGRAVALAMQIDSARLAAISFVRPRAGTLYVLVVAVVALASALVVIYAPGNTVFVSESAKGPSLLVVIPVLATYVFATMWQIDYSVRTRREDFVRDAMEGGPIDYETVLLYDFSGTRLHIDIDRLNKTGATLAARRKAGGERDAHAASEASPIVAPNVSPVHP